MAGRNVARRRTSGFTGSGHLWRLPQNGPGGPSAFAAYRPNPDCLWRRRCVTRLRGAQGRSPGTPPGFLRDCGGAGKSWRKPDGARRSREREVRLTPKASAVLKVLVTHAGKPVTKEELFASVWNDTVVSDDALTSCIQQLRRALADDSKQPRFIETRHRRAAWMTFATWLTSFV